MWIDGMWRAVGEFIALPKGASIWGALNAPISVAIIAALFAWLLKDRVQEFVKDTNQFRALEEEEPPVPPEPQPIAPKLKVGERSVPFSDASGIISKLKEFIDSQAHKASDGRNKRKYNNFPRYDYIPLVKALQDDGNIKSDLAAQLIDILDSWRPYRSGKLPVPQDIFNKMLGVQALCQEL